MSNVERNKIRGEVKNKKGCLYGLLVFLVQFLNVHNPDAQREIAEISNESDN